VNMVSHSLNYVSWKRFMEAAANLRCSYTAAKLPLSLLITFYLLNPQPVDEEHVRHRTDRAARNR
jgi:hypothetical protein